MPAVETTILTMTRRELPPDAFTRSVPVLITDGLADWPAVSRWTPDALAAAAPHKRVTLGVSETGAFRYNMDGSPRASDRFTLVKDVPLADAVARITDSRPDAPKCYVLQHDIRQLVPELLGDLRFPRHVDPEPGKLNLWFGSGGTISDLHFDGSNNLYAQIHGAKEFTILAPQETPCLYPFPTGSKVPHISRVDLAAPDLQQCPRFADAHPIVFTIEAGQLLFLPAFWWHRVKSLSTSISVNHWWTPELRQCVGPAALHLLRSEYRRDRWAMIQLTEGLSHQTLLDSAEGLLDTNPYAAVLAIAVAVESTAVPRSLKTLLHDSDAGRTWTRVVSAVERDEAALKPESVAAVARKMLRLLRSERPSITPAAAE